MASPASGPTPPARLARLPFFYGWIVVAVAFVTMGLCVNARTAFSLLFPPILAEFGWERGVTAAAFSIGFVASTLYAPFSGMLMDRLGPRYVLSFGVLLISVGMATATRIQAPWHLYVSLGVLVVGGSVFTSYIGHSLFLPNWFVWRRGLAIGIAFSGVGVGSIVIFPWMQQVIDDMGWRDACWMMAIVLCVILIPLNVLFQRQRPQDMGLMPDGSAVPSATGDGEETRSNVVDPDWAAIEWTLGRAVRTARYWWVFAGFLTALFAWYAVQVHQTKALIETGFDPGQAAYALGWVGLTGIVGQIALGHLSDRLGREWAWTAAGLGFVVCYAALLLMPRAPTPLTMYIIVASQGVLGYGLTSVMGAIPAELFQGKRYGTIFGTLSLGAGLGAACGPWVTGVIYDRTGSYALAWWMALGLSLVSILCMWLAAPRRVRAVAGQIDRLHARRR
ncbi:MAG: MFS transporter [Candidatus Entotheonella factor]|uniref:MFS transporter n=1 Tax=Entotheonella factor TaxID=1429438 RepID=W4LNR0_ENTF1|nr:MFS transporter [Candidatus Entotheonella palauensis]ETW99519.1 MAG: MFS transporter [Candidatus Entotheonella factor]